MARNSLAPLPLGLQTFAEVRKLGCAYVDKTSMAVKLAHQGKFYFLARPRRFGKSLFLDTLRNLFEGKRELFQGLHAEANWDWDVKYPVIKLDMSGGSMLDNIDDMESAALFQQLIQRAHKQHGRRVATHRRVRQTDARQH